MYDTKNELSLGDACADCPYLAFLVPDDSSPVCENSELSSQHRSWNSVLLS
jgi:hypothetical protein